MKLRRMSGCRCVRIGLAAAVVAMVVSPTALAVAEKPKPGRALGGISARADA